MGLSIIRPRRLSCAVLLLYVSFQCAFAQTEAVDTSEEPSGNTDSVVPASPAAQPAASYDTIAGPLPDTVKAHARPYLVVGDIEVPVHKTVVIEAGTIFLFKNFTGVRVLGKMEAKGLKERPVVFTSENDRSVNPASTLYPNPYDWNGISIQKSAAGTFLSYCNIFYSVYGIESETKFIRLDPVSLRFNGKSNLAIEGKVRKVGEQWYYYVLSTNDALSEGVPASLFKDPRAAKREIVRLSCYTLIIASLVGGIDSGLHYKKAKNDLSAMSTDNPMTLRTVNESDWTDLRDRRDRYRNLAIGCATALVVGVIGFSWTFTF